MKKNLCSLLTTIVFATNIFGQTLPNITTPNFKDAYSETAQKLESGVTDIDYKMFRESFIESEQFKIAKNQNEVLDSLLKEMYSFVKLKNAQEVINVTKKILGIDYTNMQAHKMLRQSYKIIGDTLNAQKYKTIQFGLLNSIVKNGDGKTCETAWHVVQIEEEYFILKMLDATLIEQRIDKKNGLCDKIKVNEEGKEKTYYFGITKVFEGYKKLGIK
jgi:Domain of unknown function (DUF4919)